MKKIIFAIVAAVSAVVAFGQAMRTYMSIDDLIAASHNPVSENRAGWVLDTNDFTCRFWFWWPDPSVAALAGLTCTNSLRPGVVGTYVLTEGLHWTRSPDIGGSNIVVVINNTNQGGLVGALTVPYLPRAIDTNRLADSHLYWTPNGTGTDTNFFFGPTNVFFRLGSDFYLTNGAANGFNLRLGDVSGYYALFGVNGSGAPTITSTRTGQPVYITAGNATGGLYVTPNSLQPGTETISIGTASSTGAFTNAYIKGATHIVGTNDGLGNYTWTELKQADTNSPFAINQITAGTAGYSRGIKFQTNGVPLVIIDGDWFTYTNGQTSAGTGLKVLNGNNKSAIFGTDSGNNASIIADSSQSVKLAPNNGSLIWNFTSFSMSPNATNATIGYDGPITRIGDIFQAGVHNLDAFQDATGTNAVRLKLYSQGTTGIFDFRSQTNGVDGPITGYSFRTNGVEVFNVTGTGGPSSGANWTAVGTTDSSLAGTATVGGSFYGGSDVASGATLTGTSDIFGFLHGSLNSSVFVNSSNVFSAGLDSMSGVLCTNSYSLFGLDNTPFLNSIVSGSYSLIGVGTASFGLSTNLNIHDCGGFGIRTFESSYNTNIYWYYGVGDSVFRYSTNENSNSAYGFGDMPLYWAHLTNSAEAYGIGNSALKSVQLNGSLNTYGFGYYPLNEAKITNSLLTFGIGDTPFYRAKLTNCIDTYAIGQFALSQATLRDCQNLYAYGVNAGYGITGAFTNVFLFGPSSPTLTRGEFVFGDPTIAQHTFQTTGLVQVANGSVSIGRTTAEEKLTITGNAAVSATVYCTDSYMTNNCSALTFTDRSSSPQTLTDAYSIVQSHQTKEGKVDHSKLHKLAWGKDKTGQPDQSSRDIGMVLSAQQMVIQDLLARIEKLEKK